MNQENNRTIAKNTLVLYVRSILMMFIGLFTSRVILQTLGVTDFGIYNAVGGIVAIFGFISSSLINATSRFITIAIGKGDQKITNATFGNIKVIYYGLCVLVVILAETIGLWFLSSKMILPAERISAAFWIYQYSILTTMIGLISVPYKSAIIAHEKMSAFALISLFDAVLKLIICYLLLIIPFDKLVIYSSLLFLVEIIDRVVYAIYSYKRFEEVRAKPRINKAQFREIMSISGWSLSGNLAWVLNTHGINIVLNMFFGPVVNAARGVALQVQGIMGQFVTNFQTAINPQITKSYADGNYNRMGNLLFFSSKFSFLLMFTISLPIFIEAPTILDLWLVNVPTHTISFLRIIIVGSVLSTLTNPLWISVLATGKLKKYMIWDNSIQFLVLPSVYMVFYFFKLEPSWAFIILVLSELLEIVIRTWIVLPLIRQKYYTYIKKVATPLILITLVSPIIPLIIYLNFQNTIGHFFLVTSSCICCTMIAIWTIGLEKSEQKVIIDTIKVKLNRNRR